jgi:muramoyltetrapeptide carboxypeptidase LdcA involved in peptidoglycan recycling
MAPHASEKRGYVAGTPEERVADIHQLFADPEVRAIIATIGGNHACHLLPLLDFDQIALHPKIFIGFSDVTVLNLAIYARTGLVTFNGPTLMTDLAEFPAPLPYMIAAFEKTLTRPEPVGTVAPAPTWTDEFLDWEAKADLTRPRRLLPSPGWTWLKGGQGAGPLVGGCLESMEHLRGTPYWPDFTGAILFLETSEITPSPAWVDATLQDYENRGVLAKLNGLLFGRPINYTPAMKESLREVIVARTRRYGFPVVTDVDFGHTAPQFILPVGCQAELDGDDRRFAITEGAVTA